MPITTSAKKALRVSQRRRKVNLKWKNNIKKALKDVRKKIEAKKIKDAEEALIKAQKVLDKAAKKNVIHKNKAARLKSRLAKAINKALAITNKNK